MVRKFWNRRVRGWFLAVALVSTGGVTQALATAAAALGSPEGTAGTVRRVTLYRGQALVTRAVKIEGNAGSHEVVVTDLPGTILDGSLYAESTTQLEVRAVRFRQRAVGEEPREEVRKLDEEIAAANAALALNQKQQELAAQRLAYLDQLQGFVAPTATTELTQGVLNAETLKELTQFAFEQRAQIAESQVTLAREQTKLSEQLQLLQRTRDELTSHAQRTVNEAILFVEKLDDAPVQVELNYLVSNCGWSPTYTIRAAEDHRQILMEYNAMIQQVTGENWDGVELTLSTASPMLSASGPSLAPFGVTLLGPDQAVQVVATDADGSSLRLNYAENRAQQMAANAQLGNVVDFMAKTNANWSLNRSACAGQQIELTNPMELLSTIIDEGDVTDAPSLSYPLANPVSIASRTDQQMVRIYRGDLASTFYHVATPLLSSYVYREAEIQNGSEIDFLGGPVSVYLGNRFVGRAEIPTVAQGETFVLGFGSDAQLRARRELASKSEGIQGGNKEVKMQYRLLIENYKNQPVNVRVMERLPYTNRAGDIRISLSEPSRPLCADQVYVRRERSKNILRWDVEVPAESTGASALEIEYGFTLDYDRNFAIADASNDQSGIREFEKLERSRQKR